MYDIRTLLDVRFPHKGCMMNSTTMHRNQVDGPLQQSKIEGNIDTVKNVPTRSNHHPPSLYGPRTLSGAFSPPMSVFRHMY